MEISILVFGYVLFFGGIVGFIISLILEILNKWSCCWHKIPNTERTLVRKDRCARANETIIQPGSFAYYKIDEECCRCDRKRSRIKKDYDISRALKYPTEKEYNE